MPAETKWTKIELTGDVPKARSGHSVTYISGSAQNSYVMYGGILDPGTAMKIQPTSEIYKLSIRGSKATWEKMEKGEGEQPIPRSQHVAVNPPKGHPRSEQVFIYGGHASPMRRLNDCWWLDTKGGEFKWTRVAGDKDVEPNQESVIGAPGPRANCGYCYANGKVFIYGGHGGVGYKRHAYDDIYSFDLTTETWEKYEQRAGFQPIPAGRGGNSIFVCNGKLYSYGGWNSETQFENLIEYDFATFEWADNDIKTTKPRWNHSSLIVEAIPSWKFFIFGGESSFFNEGEQRKFGDVVNTMQVLDLEAFKWELVKPESEENIPSAREYTAMFTMPSGNQLCIFGGWNNGWLGDMYSIDVRKIVGPPYAITKIEPNLGQLSGGDTVTITGQGFVDGAGITVWFTCGNTPVAENGRNSIGKPGTYVNDTTITCETPDFSQMAKFECVVQVQQSSNDLSTTWQRYTFFMNTRAAKSLCYGTGLLENQAINETSTFVIQARNDQCENRSSGRDQFQVFIKFDTNQEEIPAQIVDNDDGSYHVNYKVEQEGRVNIVVKFKDDKGKFVEVRGSPYTASFTAASEGKAGHQNTLTGQRLQQHLTAEILAMQTFMKESSQGAQIKDKDINDVKVLIGVKDRIDEVKDKKEEVLLRLDQIDESLKMLQAHSLAKDKQIKEYKKLADDWTYLQKLAKDMEKEIKKNIESETSKNDIQIKGLEDQLKNFSTKLKKRDFYEYKTGREKSMQLIQGVYQEIRDFETKIEDLGFNAQKFGQPQLIDNCKVSVETITKELDGMKSLWEYIDKAQQTYTSWLQQSWPACKPDDMDYDNKNMQKGLREMKVDKKSSTYMGIQDDIKKWVLFLQVISDMHSAGLRDRHWDMVRKKVGVQFAEPEKLSVNDMFNLNLTKYTDDMAEVCDQAKQEAKMEKQLKKLGETWKDVAFQFTPMKDSDIQTFKMKDEDFELLENDQMTVQSMTANRYLATFEKEVLDWQTKLGNMNENNVQWGEIQRTWSFLESLFMHSEEVKKELPVQSEQFKGIDAKVRTIFADAFKQKIALIFYNLEHIKGDFDKIEKELKVCEKALYDFMASKQKKFPRFYFVASADLLDILSNGNNPAKIMKHMPKIFQAVDTLELEDLGQNRFQAKAMKSCVGVETVQFTKSLSLLGKVENYLEDVIQTMRQTLKDIGRDSLKRFQTKEKKDWLFEDPAQITLLINMLSWVMNVEGAFNALGSNPKALYQAYEKQKTLLEELIYMVRTDLSKGNRQKVMCLITMDAHSRDIILQLNDAGVKQADEFQWQSQLKNYWDDKKMDFTFKIADAVLAYGYEYLGNGPRLVVTPLTDRIYVTATQALHLKMGCAPAGPAGTGKTETTKDLSSCLAKAVYVFNCSDQMDYVGMGGIYKGLAASGSWGCFDEFNRLLPSVLSVCSVQFKAVTDAIRENRAEFTIEGDTLTLDPTCGVFITMNPGYLGRAELPEGLKALFRPITVVVPDLELICENMLMAEGFISAKILAKKFTTLYALCRDLLSKALHYDWGLRAIKSVLVVAGGFKRAEPELPELDLLMRALRDFNTPKIVADDLKIFMGLLGDLFPQINPIRKRFMDFEKIIEDETKKEGLYPDEQFILKVVQLKELLAIRHCVFIMGPAGCGKSQTWKILCKAQTTSGEKTIAQDLNPKVQKTDQLYGIVHPQTREWIDGLMSFKMRDLSNMPDTLPKWIILDGDLDANWIESMNSVMDDNKILTLASNERIKLLPHMRLIFEIRNLKFATPATVSRAGILFISDFEGFQWRSYYQSWIDKMKYKPEQKAELAVLFDRYIAKCLLHIKKTFKYLIPVVDICLVTNLCKLLEAMYASTKHEVKNHEQLFVFCTVWCLGAGFGEKDGINVRKNFSTWWKDTFKNVKFGTGSVFEYYVDIENAQMREWKNMESGDITSKIDTSKRISSITIPTSDTIAMSFLMKQFLAVRHSPMLIGLAGCGKTQIIKGLLDEITSGAEPAFLQQVINFNFYTDSELLQLQLESQLEKRGGKAFGPKGKATLIYFIDDLNMPGPDKYDTQSAIALIRQHKDYDHWYDRQKIGTLKDIKNTMYIAAMNPTAGSFFINERLQRHFWQSCITFPEQANLTTIYMSFLNKHFKNFKPAVFDLINQNTIIKTTLAAQDQIQMQFKKTAVNFHYEFNVRHLTNVFQGMLQAKSEIIQDYDKMAKLWIHEMERIYGDRLVNAKDLATYRSIIFDQAKRNFPKANINKIFAATDPEPLVFASFVDNLDERKYDLFPNVEALNTRMKEALHQYNELNAAMNLVLFEDAMKHCCKITRIIQADAGHALLVGVGGSGKQSLSKLASYICQYNTSSIMISSTYGMLDLKTDLQNMYMRAGCKDEGICFLFTEGQITKEQFLVYINDLLSSGEIADLFDADGVDVIVGNVFTAVKGEGIVPSKDNSWRYFINRVRKNLHMSLCFSPVGDAFRNRARKFPALVNATVIDWFHPWPYEALLSVATKFLEEIEMPNDEVRNSVIKFLPFSFSEVQKLSEEVLVKDRRYIYTTPKSFLELIGLFKGMLGKKKGGLENELEKYQNGVNRLQYTTSKVGDLEAEIKEQAVIVQAAKAEAQEQAAIVEKEKTKVDAQNAIATVESEKANKVAATVNAKKISVEADLAAAEPLVIAAMKALEGLKEEDFKYIKSLPNPPTAVKNCLETVLFLFATIEKSIAVDKKGKMKEEKTWPKLLQLMAKPKDFVIMLNTLKGHIDAGNVPAQNFDAIRPRLADPEFNRERLQKASGAAAGVCEWVINITQYYDVVVSVEPKRIALREAEAQLAEAMANAKHYTDLVADLMAQLKVLTDAYDAAMSKKKNAEDTAAACERKLALATRLVNALGAEGERWAASIITTENLIQVVLGDVLLASAFVSYIGPFNMRYRNIIMKEKFAKFFKDNKIPVSENSNPLTILTNEAEMAQWQNEKLPSDEVSLQNGAILQCSDRYPLMIDPQLQGITWIKTKYAAQDLQVTRLDNKKMIHTIELCIQSGKPCMLENLQNSIDAVLQPVYARAIMWKGKSAVIKMGDKELSLAPGFKLIMHTKLSNPHYPPEIQAECTLINFTVTEKGLEDQLLALIVKKERPDLASEKERLVKQQNEFKITLKNLEADLLFRLVNQQGDILEEIELIENLEKSKALSTEIKEKVEIAKQTSIMIDEASEQYRPAAERGALVYFMMIELTKIHSFYKFSLDSFINVINRAIDIVAVEMAPPAKPPPAEGEEPAQQEQQEERELTPRTLKKRVSKLIEEITYQGYDYTRRGTFEKHKLIIATMLTLRINKRKKMITEEEEQALIKKEVPMEYDAQPPNLQSFMAESVWLAVQGLKKLNIFKELPTQIEHEHLQWKKWYGEEKAEIADLPKSQKDCQGIHKLLLLRALRPDRLTNALREYVKESLGDRYIDQEPFDMFKIYSIMKINVPVFFVLFPGVDPTPDVEKVGRTHNKSTLQGSFTNISMGQGQENKAIAALKKSAEQGHWIMIQNCHLMTDWMKVFERELEIAIEAGAHPEFRVFISSEPPPLPDMEIIPESILQNSVKVSNEAPQDLKANLKRALSKFPQAYYDKAKSHKENDFKALLFGLCMFHSLILGRRKFGSIGWSRIYNFNDGDLTICGDVLHNYLSKYEKVPYKDLCYIYGEIMYGGHITDNLDRRTNNTYLERIIQPAIMEQMQLTQSVGFKSPLPQRTDRDKYVEIVETQLPPEQPQMFGLHPNAEIGYLTADGNTLFEQILLIQGGSGKGSGSGVQGIIDDFTRKMKEETPQFSMFELKLRGGTDPFWIVCLQECERINLLLQTIMTSLTELDMGLKGQLNITDAMDVLDRSLSLGFVPSSWVEVAYPSLKSLQPWFLDMIRRYQQLKNWTDDKDMKTPDCLWISGLFNPMSFLTAIMQKTARQKTLALDKIILKCDVLNHDRSEIKAAAEDGAYIDGFFLEGAKWEVGKGDQQGYLTEQTLKELNPELPVMHVTAIEADKRVKQGYYECPIYITKQRGPTLVMIADIKMESDDTPAYKWILAGCALVMAAD